MKRTLAVAFVAGLVLTGAVAFACTNLATLNLSSAVGKPGDAVTVTGSSFRVPRDAAAPISPVVVYWAGTKPSVAHVGGQQGYGLKLAEVVPDRSGSFSVEVAVPQAAPGQYAIVAAQLNASGADEFGTPARIGFQIVGPSGEPAPVAGGTPAIVAQPEPAGAGMLALTAILGVLGLGLFGAGMRAFARQAAPPRVPAPVRKD